MSGPPLIPVGHYHGTLHGEPVTHLVRLGTQLVSLDDAEHTTWLLTHDDQPEPSEVVSRLHRRGLLAELPTGPDENAGFVARYRLEPLLHGLGNAPGAAAGRFRVGLPGERIGRWTGLSGAWAELGPLVYGMWRWAGATRSLAELCESTDAPMPPDAPMSIDAPVPLDALVEQAVRLAAVSVSGWTAALQPATSVNLVGAAARSLPAAEPADPAVAQEPEEVLELPYVPGRPDSPTAGVPRWKTDPGHPGAAGWLFAVGHDGGPFHRPDDGVFVTRVVRIGATDHRLDATGARLWEIVRGADPRRLWTRGAVVAAAVEQGVADAAVPLDDLIDRAVVVEVHPGTAQAEEFARSYRVFPLLHGLGTPEDDSRVFTYGVPGRWAARSGIDSSLLWRTAGQWPTLWDTLVAQADHFQRLGVADPTLTDPSELLTARGFHAIRDLVEAGVAYLDVAP
ncbi:hypothetical protein [Cryptosporangium arvum]|uniref:hypothetical protein n=1 Tax=Cryptosporangium arvum TaxID=80871 RepID=UPI0004AFB4EE|nr:hypothetical protein [Cryptosporangium arvum]